MSQKRSFENFKPLLRPGKVTPQGRRLVYETDDGKHQIVLPAEMADLLLLASGKFTVREIIEKIFRRKGSVPFRTLYNTIHQLRDHGFLDNGDELESHSWWSPNQVRKQLSYDIPLLKRIAWRRPWPMAFYALSMILLSLTIGALSIAIWPPLQIDSFLRTSSSLLILASILGLTSVFLSAQALVQVAFQLLLTGNMFGLFLRLAPWGIYLKATDEPIFLITNRLFLTLYFGAVISTPVLVTWFVVLVNPNLHVLAWAVAVAKLAWDTSPMNASRFTQTVRSLLSLGHADLVAGYLPENSLVALLGPHGEKPRSRSLRRYFLLYTIAWSSMALWLCAMGLADAGVLLLTQPLVAVIGWLSFSGYGFWLLYRIALQIAPAMAKTFTITKAWVRARLETLRPTKWEKDALIEALLRLPLFSYFSTSLLESMLEKSQVIQVQGGSRLITQGEIGRDLFVLLSGSMAVEKTSFNEGRSRLSVLRPISIFGEMAMLEDSVRGADVIARETSTVLRVPTDYLKKAAKESQYVREISAFQNAILVNQFFTSAPMFKDLPEDLAHDISMRSSLRTYTQGDTILRQGDYGRSFFMILRGSVDVQIDGRTVKSIRQGGFFGEISLIADIPRTASVVAHEPTIVMEMAAVNFWEVMCQNIELAMFIETVGESRLSEDLAQAKAG